jgi:prefoldin beta subunit
MQNLSMQRQQFQIQEAEIESALKELENTKHSYKIIGNIMVAVDKDSLKKDLQEKQQMITIRISSIEKQESKLQEKVADLQKDVLKAMEEKPKVKKQQNGNESTN